MGLKEAQSRYACARRRECRQRFCFQPNSCQSCPDAFFYRILPHERSVGSCGSPGASIAPSFPVRQSERASRLVLSSTTFGRPTHRSCEPLLFVLPVSRDSVADPTSAFVQFTGVLKTFRCGRKSDRNPFSAARAIEIQVSETKPATVHPETL